MADDEASWHLDKRVPIALIFAFVIQTITLVYVGTNWKSDIDHRVVALEKSDDMRRPQSDRLLTVEIRLGTIQDSLKRIEEKLEGQPRP